MWKDWLTFSRGERLGISVMAILVMLFIIISGLRDVFWPKPQVFNDPKILAEVDSFIASLSYVPPQDYSSFSFEREERFVSRREVETFPFDPNTITISNLERLGFSRSQAEVIGRYRSRGGKFRQPDDFARMYVVDSSTFVRLRPYIEIEPPKEERIARAEESDIERQPVMPSAREGAEAVRVNINTSDTLDLIALRGVGRVYARRIVAYRELLGGYYSADQLKEVFGVPGDLVDGLRDNLIIDSTAIRPIHINMVSYHELRQHPYISDYQAKAIVYYRETVGSFSALDDFIVNNLLDSANLGRVRPYIAL